MGLALVGRSAFSTVAGVALVARVANRSGVLIFAEWLLVEHAPGRLAGVLHVGAGLSGAGVLRVAAVGAIVRHLVGMNAARLLAVRHGAVAALRMVGRRRLVVIESP